MDIPFDVIAPIEAAWMDGELRPRLEGFAGVSVLDTRVTVHLGKRPTNAELAMIRQIVEGGSYGLTLVTAKPQIIADGSDTSSIICNNAVIAADASLAYTVTFTGLIDGVNYVDGDYASGSANVENGAVTLQLAVEYVGTYRVHLRRTAQGAQEFGSTVITAVGA